MHRVGYPPLIVRNLLVCLALRLEYTRWTTVRGSLSYLSPAIGYRSHVEGVERSYLGFSTRKT